jgi:phage FluMu gp28-like protein
MNHFFLPYQRAWINDPSRLKLCQKGRQIGLSLADSYDSVRKAALNGGRDVWVMSRDETQAKQYIRYCRQWARVLNLAAQDHHDHVLRSPGTKGLKAHELEFANGAHIYALSSNPDAIAGKSGHVKLDEFALHREQRTLYAVAKPVIQWGGTLAIISTHRGAESVFNQIINDIVEHGNPMGWSMHKIPIQRAAGEGLVEKIDRATGGSWAVRCENENIKHQTPNFKEAPSPNLQASNELLETNGNNSGIRNPNSAFSSDNSALCTPHSSLRSYWLAQQRAECIDEEQWLQEYCCVPADESAAFISYELLNACSDPEIRLMSIPQLMEYAAQAAQSANAEKFALYLGVDVARKTDLCVFDVGEKIRDVVWDRARLELSGRTFSEIEGELHRLLRMSAIKRVCIDATGLGMQLAEQAKEKFGWKVEPITFTAPLKEELAFNMRSDFEDRKMRIASDDKLSADLHAMRKEVTSSGNFRFGGESGESHCDRFWAKALRQHAAQYKSKVWARVG